MMFDSVLVKVSCSEELLYLHTISRRHKSPYRFAILRDTLEQLEREPGRQIIVADCGCYARPSAHTGTGRRDAGDPFFLAAKRRCGQPARL